MKKRLSIIGTGIGAFALAAVIGVSGVFSNSAYAAVQTTPNGNTQPAQEKVMRSPYQEIGLTDAQIQALNIANESQIKSALAALVAAGTLTQEQADALAPGQIKTEIPERLELSEAQETALTEAKTAANAAAKDELVSSGLLTEEQAAGFCEIKEFKESGFDKSGLTREQADKPDGQKTMVKRGLSGIDPEKMQEVSTILEKHMKTELDKLVSSGVFTREEADKLVPGHEFARITLPELTEAQRDAVNSAIKSAREAALDSLVAAGTITQEQADKLAESPAKGFGIMAGKPGAMPAPEDMDALEDMAAPGGMSFKFKGPGGYFDSTFHIEPAE